MQYMILGWDGQDPDAKERRLRYREAHLEGVRRMQSEGTFISGGAILDEAGDMIGSTLHVEFDSKESLDSWLRKDPYVTGGVWKNVEVRPIRLVPR